MNEPIRGWLKWILENFGESPSVNKEMKDRWNPWWDDLKQSVADEVSLLDYEMGDNLSGYSDEEISELVDELYPDIVAQWYGEEEEEVVSSPKLPFTASPKKTEPKVQPVVLTLNHSVDPEWVKEHAALLHSILSGEDLSVSKQAMQARANAQVPIEEPKVMKHRKYQFDELPDG